MSLLQNYQPKKRGMLHLTPNDSFLKGIELKN